VTPTTSSAVQFDFSGATARVAHGSFVPILSGPSAQQQLSFGLPVLVDDCAHLCILHGVLPLVQSFSSSVQFRDLYTPSVNSPCSSESYSAISRLAPLGISVVPPGTPLIVRSVSHRECYNRGSFSRDTRFPPCLSVLCSSYSFYCSPPFYTKPKSACTSRVSFDVCIQHFSTVTLANASNHFISDLGDEKPPPRPISQSDVSTTMDIETISAYERRSNTAIKQTITTNLTQQSVQFQKQLPPIISTADTQTTTYTTAICDRVLDFIPATLLSSRPHAVEHSPSFISPTVIGHVCDSMFAACEPSVCDVGIMCDVEFPNSFVIPSDSSHFIGSTSLSLHPHMCSVATQSAVSSLDSFTQVLLEPLEFFLSERFTHSTGRFVSLTDLVRILDSYDLPLVESHPCPILCAASSQFSVLDQPLASSVVKYDSQYSMQQVYHSVSHTHTHYDADLTTMRKETREVSTSCLPTPTQQADVGVSVALITTNGSGLSPWDLYSLKYQLGHIAETHVSVTVGTESSACQTKGYTDYRLLYDHQSTQTDRYDDEEISEATTKLNITQITKIDSTEDIISKISQDHQSTLFSAATETFHPQSCSVMEFIRCQVRERTVQYELMQARRGKEVFCSDHIREMASPHTGLRTPIGTAVRSGWVKPGDHGLHIDPITNTPMWIENAEAEGLVTLDVAGQSYNDNVELSNEPSLLLIERIAYSWRPVRIVSFTDTKTRVKYGIDEALRRGFIDLSSGEPVIYNRDADMWISTEEAAGREIIELEAIDPTEAEGEVIEETYSCRVFRITAVRPGGEPSDWLDPLEAARIGLFRWRTGEVAAEWQARPELPAFGRHTSRMPSRFMPTQWCSLLTARKAGWLRLQAEVHPTEWVLSMPTCESDVSHIILATYDHLVVPNTIPLTKSPNLTRVEYQQPSSTSPNRPPSTRASPTRTHQAYIEQYRKKSSRSSRRVTRESYRTRSDAYLHETERTHSLYHRRDAQIFSGTTARRPYLSEEYLTKHDIPYMVPEFEPWDYGQGM
ncbi:hypothetical protein PHET_10314, partial [Paragonimus heterotremus]